ncbi:hypothetical protein [Deinococcus aestuarii]|uniref:hypothetical protein n=1 Tax=Deinococcus aestuarii TaxID=2774531 RepID=UPI001C0B2979|nr:hypothetical protein [Deinococcus aestuarii]
MQDQAEELRRNILITLQNGSRANPDRWFPAQSLAEPLVADRRELYILMEELTKEGYLETTHIFGELEERAASQPFRLSRDGVRAANHIRQHGTFPPVYTPPTHQYNNTFQADQINVQQGDYNTMHASYAPGIDGEAFERALKGFRESLHHLPDQDLREEGELRAGQLARAVRQGDAEPQKQRFMQYAEGLRQWAETTTAVAVTYNGAVLLLRVFGVYLPELPVALGQ